MTDGSYRVALGFGRPNLLFEIGPQLLSGGPFWLGFVKSQAGTDDPFPVGSFHDRVTLFTDVLKGLLSAAICAMCWRFTKRPNEAFSAVFPFPNRSYAAPNRGSRSVQQGTQWTAPKLRAKGTNGVAGAELAGTKLSK